MEFRETLLAAQRNQQQKSSENVYYKARFDPPKKEQKQKDKLSANIQKFLAKKEEEEKQKKLEAQKKREELLAMRDPKAIRKIQKTLKVIKSANKSVLEDAVDRENTAVTREGPDQPDQDDYGYESQEAAALYEKMMQKYSKIPDEPKFPVGSTSSKKDLNGTRERVKQALQHEDDPIPHKRRRKKDGEKELSPPPKFEPEKRKDEKPEKPKIRRPAPPPMDFNQLLKLAEQKKSVPIDVVAKKQVAEPEPERLMTKRQKKEYEEEMARRQRRQERLDNDKGRKVQREEKPAEKKAEPIGLGRIPKIGEKNVNSQRHDSPKVSEKDRYDKERAEKLQRDKEKIKSDRERLEREKEKFEREREKDRYEKYRERERYDKDREKERHDKEKEKERYEKEREKERFAQEREKERFDRDKGDRIRAEKERIDKERLEKLKAERERIERDIDRLNRDRDRLEKEKLKLDSLKNEKINKPIDRSKIISKEQRTEPGVKKTIDLKSQNTYRIDKNSNEKRYDSKNITAKPVPKQNEIQKNGIKDKAMLVKQKALFNEKSPKLNGHNKPEQSKPIPKRPDDRKPLPSAKSQVNPKPKITNTFDFDKHVNSLSRKPPNDVKKKSTGDDRRGQKRRVVQSDSEYDSEMDDFIDDGEEDMDYSKHIKEIFGYDKSKYRDMDDDDDPDMESSFARQQREEYISKKIGIMEDLEDMRMEAMEKKKSKKKRRISDD